jgi:hypothetical protein
VKAISDINIRAKWDKYLGAIEVLEHNKEADQTYFRFNVNVPAHMQKREAVLVRKVLKDFPKLNETTIIQKVLSTLVVQRITRLPLELRCV